MMEETINKIDEDNVEVVRTEKQQFSRGQLEAYIKELNEQMALYSNILATLDKSTEETA